jgi:hypothetical protein
LSSYGIPQSHEPPSSLVAVRGNRSLEFPRKILFLDSKADLMMASFSRPSAVLQPSAVEEKDREDLRGKRSSRKKIFFKTKLISKFRKLRVRKLREKSEKHLEAKKNLKKNRQ